MGNHLKPNCYECKYRGDLPGDAHSCCNHPLNKADIDDPINQVFSILASVGRVSPSIGGAAKELNIKANAYGVRSGWFNWPFNFDPAWLENCDGFEASQK